MGWREIAGVAPNSDWRAAAGVVKRDQSQPQKSPLDEGIEAQPAPTSLQSAASGVVQGASLGFGDELGAAVDTGAEAVHRGIQALGLADKPNANIEGHYDQASANAAADKERGTLGDYYRQMRDNYRAENKAAESAHPVLFGAGKLAGNLAVPIPGGAAKTVLGKVGVGAAKGLGFGTALGAGESEAADVGGVVKDAGKSGAFGAAGGAVGGGIEAGAGAIGARLAARAGEIRTDAAAKALEEALATAKGDLGHSVQDSNRALMNMKEALKDPNVHDFVKRDIEAFLGSQKGKDLVNQVAQNTLDAAPEKLGNMAAKKAAYASAPLEAAANFAAKDAESVLAKKALPRLWHYLRPGLAAGAGGLLGGPIGAASGGVLGAAAGKPGRAAANFVKDPFVQAHTLDALESLAGAGEKLAPRLGLEAGLKMQARDADGNVLYDENPDEQSALAKRFNPKKR